MPPRHVLETYIKSSPERIWAALTEPGFTERYFFASRAASDWEVGSPYRFDGPDGTTAVEGEVVESVPPQRLVLTFRACWDPAAADEPPSRVTWEITPLGDVCRLSCVHGDLGLSPRTWEITTGWGVVLSGLKTLLETGDDLGPVPDDGRSVLAAQQPAEIAWHRSLAAEANNGTYDLLAEREATPPAERTALADDRVVHRAHAAAYHWGIAGGIEQWAMAEYLCSRVYAFLGRAEPALHHAARSAALGEEAGFGGWQLAFVLEAQARALACAGRTAEAGEVLRQALAVPIDDPDDASIFLGDVEAGPWYGVDVAAQRGAASV